MQAQVTGRRAARLAKVLVDVAWWLTLAATAIGVGLLLFGPVLTAGNLHVEAKVSVPDEAAERLLPLSSPDTVVAADPVLKGLEGSLVVRPSDWWLLLLGGMAVVPALAALLFGLHLLRSFLRDVVTADVFTEANAQRLSRLGWLIVAAAVSLPVLRFAFSLVVVRRAAVAGVPLRVGIDFPIAAVLGILVLVVAAAWRYGVELQKDRDLTV